MFIATLKSFVVALFLFATLFGVAGGILHAAELGMHGMVGAVIAGVCSFCIAMWLANRWYLTNDEIMAGLAQLAALGSTTIFPIIYWGVGVPAASHADAVVLFGALTAITLLAAGTATIATYKPVH
jgi:MFS-type transporter involved in bile tolerance (Atg22 family)